MLVYDPATNPLNTNEWAFPLCECLHIAAFTFSIGTIGFLDLRLLGVDLAHRGPAELLAATEIWTLIGLILVIASGLAIFSSDPVMYLHNVPFQLKMLTVIVAIIFHYTLHRRTIQKRPGRVASVTVALTSVSLWWALILGGVFIGFY
jgi:hypothetical protein